MLRVESIEYLDEEREVFDIEVETDHSFIVYGAVLHNCPMCGLEDGRIYGPDEPRPQLPAHPGCRGLYTPILKSFRELGFDAAELPPSTRASMDGQVAEYETYKDWLAKTTDARRIEALGPGRAALYKQGLGLDEMVKDGKLVPLKDLRAPAKKGRAA